MNAKFPKLFERGQIGTLEISNRIIKASTYTQTAIDGFVTDRLIRFYEEQARGGVGLVMVEISRVNGKEGPSGMPELDKDHFIPGLSELAEAIRDNGARAGIQLAHLGFHADPPQKCVSLELPPEELDFFKSRGGVELQEYTAEEIQELIAAYGDATIRAREASFDIVELNAAHGHGIAQFLSARTNRRTDNYGGSPENRMRFLIETVADIRRKVARDFPLSVRLSGTEYYPDGIMIEDTLEVAKVLEKAGVDVIHVSGGVALGSTNHHCTATMSMPLGNNVWAAEAIKKAVRIPVVASGSITTPELAEEILKKGKADFISLARPLFADPHWAQKAKEGRLEDIRPCIRCNDGCRQRMLIPRPVRVMCTVNATLGKEERLPVIPTQRRKKVAIAGGGPAGMEAARVCALRGHKVTIYEKRKLGGALIEASIPEFKSDLRRLINYYVTQVTKLKIEVINDEATVATIKDGKFDAVIVAVGAALIKPVVPGIAKPIVTNVLAVLNGKAHLGQRIHIVGGGVIGVEVGLFLAEQGKEIVFTTRQDELMTNVPLLDRLVYQELLAKQKVTIYTRRRLDAVLDKGAIVVDSSANRQEISADTVVLATGFVPQTALRDQLEKEKRLDVYSAGDCVNPRTIFDSIHEAHFTARKI